MEVIVLKLGGHDKNVKTGFLPSITGNQPCLTDNTVGVQVTATSPYPEPAQSTHIPLPEDPS